MCNKYVHYSKQGYLWTLSTQEYRLKPMNDQPNALQPTQNDIEKKYRYRGNRKQKLFMEYYTNPESETFANVYKSGLKAGFSPSYSKNIANVAPSWLVSFIDKMDLTADHIKLGISKIATGEINSRSVDDTRLKAYELLMKIEGMDKNTSTTNINIVQPILSGIVTKDPETPKAVIDLDDD